MLSGAFVSHRVQVAHGLGFFSGHVLSSRCCAGLLMLGMGWCGDGTLSGTAPWLQGPAGKGLVKGWGVPAGLR